MNCQSTSLFVRSPNKLYMILQCLRPRLLSTNERASPPKPTDLTSNWVTICGQQYVKDAWHNITPRIIELTQRTLHNVHNHPINLIKRRVMDYILKRHARRSDDGQPGSPLFSMHDQLSPVVTTRQNFDNLLIPTDHPSRMRTDTYYINETTLLRSHTTAHQLDLISSGLNAFLFVGDVYRRDEIDALHYPVFHQLDGVRLFDADELFRNAVDPSRSLKLFEKLSSNSPYNHPELHQFNALPSYMFPSDRQPIHTYETAKCLEFELKTVLQDMARFLFGPSTQFRWIEAYFPFTHPSWELEIKTKIGYSHEGLEEWTEILGCGLIRQEILDRAGIPNKVGYAFGLGLERWAMKLYDIPDIRLFWSTDSGFLHQFETDDIHASIKYKPISVFPPCTLDLSFWLNSTMPVDETMEDSLRILERDFCDIVRSVAGDLIEQIRLIDTYLDSRTGRQSLCYRLVYRDQTCTLTLDQVRPLHERIAEIVAEQFNVQIR